MLLTLHHQRPHHSDSLHLPLISGSKTEEEEGECAGETMDVVEYGQIRGL